RHDNADRHRCFRGGVRRGRPRRQRVGASPEPGRADRICRPVYRHVMRARPAPDADGPSPWRPLRTPLFRNLLLANVTSDIGTFMQTVGAAWLMVSLRAGPMYVALTQTASALPFFVFALPAGAIGDIVDRRKLILYSVLWT